MMVLTAAAAAHTNGSSAQTFLFGLILGMLIGGALVKFIAKHLVLRDLGKAERKARINAINSVRKIL